MDEEFKVIFNNEEITFVNLEECFEFENSEEDLRLQNLEKNVLSFKDFSKTFD